MPCLVSLLADWPDFLPEQAVRIKPTDAKTTPNDKIFLNFTFIISVLHNINTEQFINKFIN